MITALRRVPNSGSHHNDQLESVLRDYPAVVSSSVMPPQPHVSAGLPKKIRKAGAPLAVLILLGTVVGLIVIGLTAVNPMGTAIGFVLSSVAMTLVVLAYVWLDRWEPEPPQLLVFAFLWGASVAVVVASTIQIYAESVINPGETEATSSFSLVLGAPLTEEAAKGLFLLLMMTGRRRNELNSLTDCLVYAGLVGAGFAWLEDVLYIADSASLSESLFTAALRLVMGPFAHSLFTTMFGMGVYLALQQRNAAAKAGCILLGYLGAVFMHGLWNGSTLVGFEAYLIIYAFWMVPVFVLIIVLGVQSRRREQRVVAEKLPGMIAAGLVTPNEASWLGSMPNRKLAINEATRTGGRPAGKTVKKFAGQVVELAFVRDRIDRGFGDHRVFTLQQEEVNGLAAARAAAPALHTLAGYRSPSP
jgi:RsiW-degrading membrane proteinase PrsW (M82 family)